MVYMHLDISCELVKAAPAQPAILRRAGRAHVGNPVALQRFVNLSCRFAETSPTRVSSCLFRLLQVEGWNQLHAEAGQPHFPGYRPRLVTELEWSILVYSALEGALSPLGPRGTDFMSFDDLGVRWLEPIPEHPLDDFAQALGVWLESEPAHRVQRKRRRRA